MPAADGDAGRPYRVGASPRAFQPGLHHALQQRSTQPGRRGVSTPGHNTNE
ncbi:MAG: hypothetical protein ABJD97_10155 [Betaproteobacteria bacterium]